LINEQVVQYGDSSVAARVIHSALSILVAPLPGHRITKDSATWNIDGMLFDMKPNDPQSLVYLEL
jgi:hypothetical protein